MKEFGIEKKIAHLAASIAVLSAGFGCRVVEPSPVQRIPEQSVQNTPTPTKTPAPTPTPTEVPNEVLASCIERGEQHKSTIEFSKRGNGVFGYYEVDLKPDALSGRQPKYSLQTTDPDCPALNLVFTRNPDGTTTVLGKIEAGGGKIEWINRLPPGSFERDSRFMFLTAEGWDNIYPLPGTGGDIEVDRPKVKPRFP